MSTDMIAVQMPRLLAEKIAAIVSAHMDEYQVEDEWQVIEGVRALSPERAAALYRLRRYHINGGTVWDLVDHVDIETEFANSKAARAWVNEHGKTAP